MSDSHKIKKNEHNDLKWRKKFSEKIFLVNFTEMCENVWKQREKGHSCKILRTNCKILNFWKMRRDFMFASFLQAMLNSPRSFYTTHRFSCVSYFPPLTLFQTQFSLSRTQSNILFCALFLRLKQKDFPYDDWFGYEN